MVTILHDLYFGRIGYERHRVRTEEAKKIDEKIIAERKYFEEKMTGDDIKRFRALESLYTQAGDSDETDAFIYGFKLAVKIMCATFTEDTNKCTDT